MNIVHQHKTLIALPPRQATRSIGRFFIDHYNMIDHRGNTSSQHTTHIPKDTESYDIVMTVRNPYFRYLSWVSWAHTTNQTIDRERLASDFGGWYTAQNSLSERVKYWVRTESIAKDILEIPFVAVDYKEGKVDPIKTFDVNAYKSTYKEEWIKDLHEYASLIYDSCEWVFNKFGYNKDSYRNAG